MSTTNDLQVQSSVVPPPLPSIPTPSLDDLIKQWEKDGVTLELIIAMIMSNPEGIGAMDITSNSIAKITEQSNILSKVQTDIITLNSILSKIESQLGTKASVSQTMWDSFMKNGGKTLMQQFQNTYKALFVGTQSDISQLAAFTKKFPTLAPIIAGVENWQKDDFNTALNGSSSTFDKDIQNWNGQDFNFNSSAFFKDITFMAAQHYAANHPSSDGSKSGATDFLQNWWTDGNADQQLVSGQSQQDTTQVQSYMQLLQGFDSSAQQDIQLASTQKSQFIQNERVS